MVPVDWALVRGETPGSPGSDFSRFTIGDSPSQLEDDSTPRDDPVDKSNPLESTGDARVPTGVDMVPVNNEMPSRDQISTAMDGVESSGDAGGPPDGPLTKSEEMDVSDDDVVDTGAGHQVVGVQRGVVGIVNASDSLQIGKKRKAPDDGMELRGGEPGR
ncbi:hypothetical protein JAAARDRAFT_651220 [Jaapia argillacea MUCL 33604]|uniref:Uncharacterized protein n=1 Tax=Jaapia argillacea MUCL 33604 TaxID=933084 RepID=A0A067PWH3_9AGAM|nr:hypothetical protein JAAARDRAFT_651220 [Jaapia argillacea MUCL 33604]